jgi:hypothetical protein
MKRVAKSRMEVNMAGATIGEVAVTDRLAYWRSGHGAKGA